MFDLAHLHQFKANVHVESPHLILDRLKHHMTTVSWSNNLHFNLMRTNRRSLLSCFKSVTCRVFFFIKSTSMFKLSHRRSADSLTYPDRHWQEFKAVCSGSPSSAECFSATNPARPPALAGSSELRALLSKLFVFWIQQNSVLTSLDQ